MNESQDNPIAGHIRPDGPDAACAPEGAGDSPGRAADERFIHGLLSHIYCDTPGARDERISRVMESIVPRRQARSGVLARLGNWRMLSGVAAAVLVVVSLMMMLPTQSSALAVVESSLSAGKVAGDRRYSVSAGFGPEQGGLPLLSATVDIRDENHMVVVAAGPGGRRIAFGRDGESVWTIGPDGEVIPKEAMRRGPPKWLEVGDSTILVETVENALEGMKAEYDLKRGSAAPDPSSTGSGVLFERVSAVRKTRGGPEPEKIELWIDRQTRLVTRMEMHWPSFEGMRHRREGQSGERGTTGERRWPEGSERWSRRRDGRAGDSGRPGEPGDDERRDGDDRRPREPGMKDGVRPEGPPPGEPEHGAPRSGPEGKVDGDRGPGPDGSDEGRGHRRPCFIDGPPEFERGRHPPPPRLIVVQLVNTDPFPDGWFS